MAKKVYRNVTRERRLTKSEATKYSKIRVEVEEEIRPAKADPIKVAIAKLRAMREARGLSLADLAESTGMTRGNIARLESQKNATLRTLERYAAGMGCTLEIGFTPKVARDRAKATAR